MAGPEGEDTMPIVETTMDVCLFLNGKVGPRVDAFKKDGYFSYGDVIVCAEGTRERVSKRLRGEQLDPPHKGVWVNATQSRDEFRRAELLEKQAEAATK